MRILFFVFALLSFCFPAALRSAEAKAEYDRLPLEFLEHPQRWSCAESTVEREAELLAARPILRQNISVDHFAGEEKYPIGWPRMYFKVKGDEGSWQDYDTLEFQVRAEVSRPEMKRIPLALQIGNQNKKTYRLSIDPVHGEWKTISIPLANLPTPRQIVHFGFNISDSDYQHGDLLHFRFSGFELLRSRFCQVERLKITGPAIFSDSAKLELEISISGPAADAARGVPLQIQQGEKILRLETLPVIRGRSNMSLDISELRLQPGDYLLTAFPNTPERRKEASFKVVSSPWEKQQ